MARKVKQFRFYQHSATTGKGDSRNQPANITVNNLKSGSIFSQYYPIVQLGIQSVPGVKFYLNKGEEPIIIGETGIYDLELDNSTQINHLSFAVDSVNMINANPNSYIIIDMIYEGQGA